MQFKPYKKELYERNIVRYKGKPPSKELVTECMNKAGMRRETFEIAYGIVKKTLERYQKGLRGLPVIYWHIFYEFDTLEKFYSTFMIKTKRKARKVADEQVPVTPKISDTNKALIDAFKKRFD